MGRRGVLDSADRREQRVNEGTDAEEETTTAVKTTKAATAVIERQRGCLRQEAIGED